MTKSASSAKATTAASSATHPCSCLLGTGKVCSSVTKKSFAQGHDARMSSRIATAIAEGRMDRKEGEVTIRKAGGGDQLVSKTLWSADLRAKKVSAKTKTCRSCDKPVAKKGDAKAAGLCDECNDEALAENARLDGHDDPMVSEDLSDVVETPAAEGEGPVDMTTGDPLEWTKATIKIGRWTYEAQIDGHGDAHYKNRREEDMVAVAGSFKTV